MIRFLSVLLIIIGLTFQSCLFIKYSYKFDNQVNAYCLNFSKNQRLLVLREPSGKKMFNKEELNRLMEQLNNPQTRRNALRNIENTCWTKKESVKFQAIDYYYSGLEAFEQKRFDEARALFEKAVARDPQITEFSDLFFYMARCYEEMGNADKAKEYYQHFLEYSESIGQNPMGKGPFYLTKEDPENQLFSNLIQEAKLRVINLSAGNPSFSDVNYHDEPLAAVYQPRSYLPGFVSSGRFLERKTFSFAFGFGSAKDSYYDLGFGTSLTRNIDINIEGYHYTDYEGICIFPIFVFYPEKHRRIGIALSPFLNYAHWNLSWANVTFPDFGASLSAGAYLNHYLYLGSLYTYHYFNEKSPYHVDGGTVWYYNSWRIEATTFILSPLLEPFVSYNNDGVHFGFYFLQNYLRLDYGLKKGELSSTLVSINF